MSLISLPTSLARLTSLLWGAATFFLLLAVWSGLQSRFSCKRRDTETIEWGGPRPSWSQRWRTKMSKIRFSLPRFAKQRTLEITPEATPSAVNPLVASLNKPTQPVLALFGLTFGAPNGEPKESFAWNETNEIE